MNDCLFCKIVSGQIPSYLVWQDDKFLAILDIFPSTLGQTLVISKVHHTSDFSKLADTDLKDLIVATKKVAKILNSYFDDVNRSCLIFEGFDIDHIHAKLYPIHGKLSLKEYLCHPPQKADDKALLELQSNITNYKH